MSDQPLTPRQRLLLGVLSIAIPAAGVLVWISVGDSGDGAGPAPTDASPSWTSTGSHDGDARLDPDVSSSPTPTGASPTAPASASPSTQPTLDGEDHPDAEGIVDVEEPPWDPEGDREPSPDDAAAGRSALDAVVPPWAQLNLADHQQWDAQIGSLAEASREFVATSTRRFNDLWGGALQARVNVTDASIVAAESLWNIGTHALWRVTVERTLRGEPGAEALNGTEQVTWDFLIRQGNPFLVVDFADPLPANEDPATFRPSGGVS